MLGVAAADCLLVTEPLMEEQPTRRKGAGWMLHMPEMAVVLDAHRMQPADLRVRGDAYFKAKGLPEVEPLPKADQAAAGLKHPLEPLEESDV